MDNYASEASGLTEGWITFYSSVIKGYNTLFGVRKTFFYYILKLPMANQICQIVVFSVFTKAVQKNKLLLSITLGTFFNEPSNLHACWLKILI